MPYIFTISNLIYKSSYFHSSDPINLAAFFPTSFKHAIITTILKKPLLDPNIIANYRPILQLSFLRKILERIVAIQLNRYIAEHKLYDIFQSTFILN